MNERCTSFLIIDIRSKQDYSSCRIEYATSINVPEEILQPGRNYLVIRHVTWAEYVYIFSHVLMHICDVLLGITCKQIERQINVEYRSTWIARHQRDMLIVLDWTSNSFDQSVSMNILKEAIQKWDDPNAKYKCERKLHILKGGLENFVLTWPTCVVNPQKARNPPKDKRKKAKDSKRIDELTKAIEYPDLDAAFIASPSPGRQASAIVETKRSNPSSAIAITQISSENRYFSGVNKNRIKIQKAIMEMGLLIIFCDGTELTNFFYIIFSKFMSQQPLHNNINPSKETIFNNHSMYPKTDDLKSIAAFTSGAIKTSKESSPRRNLGVSTPMIDRSSKPQTSANTLDVEMMNARNSAVSFAADNGAKIDGSINLLNETLNSTRLGIDTPTSGNSLLNNNLHDTSCKSLNSVSNNIALNEIEDTNYSKTNLDVPVVPDRSLKARVLLQSSGTQSSKYGHAEMQITTENEMNRVLEAEEDLLEDSMELEKKQLIMEQEWELLRKKREKEAEEEMKEQIKLNEEALLDKLHQLDEEKHDKMVENEKLRDQLKLLKDKLNLESALRKTMEIDLQKQEDITKKEQEHLRLKKELELKRQQRKQQQMIDLEERQRSLHEAEVRRQAAEKELAAREAQSRQRQKVPLKGDDDYQDNRIGLVRRSFSHSSPNIAKMMEAEDAAASDSAATIPTPQFSRELKPVGRDHTTNDGPSSTMQRNVLRGSEVGARNFQGILRASGGKRGLTGLKNLGNTCYMNSILQCLSNFTIPSQYFMDQTYERDLNRRSSYTKGEVAIEYAQLIRALWSGQYKSIAPSDFKRVIGRYNEDFRAYDQQDAHELLSHLIEWLHDDLNEIRGKKETLPEQKNEGLSDYQAASSAWEIEKRVDKSFIRETFYGQWRSILRCPECKWCSIKYEVFFELVLQLPDGNGRCTLNQCIESFLKPEKVDYKCPKCKVRLTKHSAKVRIKAILP